MLFPSTFYPVYEEGYVYQQLRGYSACQKTAKFDFKAVQFHEVLLRVTKQESHIFCKAKRSVIGPALVLF